jgi:hypothetical protein
MYECGTLRPAEAFPEGNWEGGIIMKNEPSWCIIYVCTNSHNKIPSITIIY